MFDLYLSTHLLLVLTCFWRDGNLLVSAWSRALSYPFEHITGVHNPSLFGLVRSHALREHCTWFCGPRLVFLPFRFLLPHSFKKTFRKSVPI